MTSARLDEQRACQCQVNCCLHYHADEMLKMLYQYAGECAECEGEGTAHYDCGGDYERPEDCGACADIRELIKLVDPCGDRLTRVERLRREAAEEPEDDIAF